MSPAGDITEVICVAMRTAIRGWWKVLGAVSVVVALALGLSFGLSAGKVKTAGADAAGDQAVQWAGSKEGSTQWDNPPMCLKFVYDAYQAAGKDIGTANSAIDYWNNHPSQQQPGDNPPSGALVFWNAETGNPDGHVAISRGDGTAWSSTERSYSGVHWLTIAYRNQTKPYLGFILP